MIVGKQTVAPNSYDLPSFVCCTKTQLFLTKLSLQFLLSLGGKGLTCASFITMLRYRLFSFKFGLTYLLPVNPPQLPELYKNVCIIKAYQYSNVNSCLSNIHSLFS